MNYPSVPINDLHVTRISKHSQIVSDVLLDLAKLKKDHALKVALKELNDDGVIRSIRSALHRRAKKQNMEVQTVSSKGVLYIYRKE